MPSEYEAALKKAKEELVACIHERSEIDKKIGRLKGIVEALSALCEEPPPADTPGVSGAIDLMEGLTKSLGAMGITATVRYVLSESAVPLTPVEIRNAIEHQKIDLNEYANPMAVIHNTLNRLISQGEIIRVGPAYTMNRQEPAGDTWVGRAVNIGPQGGLLKVPKPAWKKPE